MSIVTVDDGDKLMLVDCEPYWIDHEGGEALDLDINDVQVDGQSILDDLTLEELCDIERLALDAINSGEEYEHPYDCWEQS